MKHRGLLLGMLFGTLLSCSLLVGGEPESIRCSQEGRRGPPACEVGWTCRSGICEANPAGGKGSLDAGSAGAP